MIAGDVKRLIDDCLIPDDRYILSYAYIENSKSRLIGIKIVLLFLV